MMACMFCKRNGKIFNVYQNYGNTDNTIRDDMVEFFGIEAENYLKADDSVCNVCMNMLDNIAKLKRRLWLIICNPGEFKYALKLGKFFDVFASLKFEDEDFDGDPITPCRTPTPSVCKTPTPINLLNYSYSIPYDSQLESAIAERERYRSQSRSSSKPRSDVSTNEEIESIFQKKTRRKKRGHNFSRRKSHKRVRSVQSLDTWPKVAGRRRRLRSVQTDNGGTYSPFSDCSYLSSYEERVKRRKRFTQGRNLEYDEFGILLNKRTRSVCKLQEEEAKRIAEEEENKYYCDEPDCPLYSDDLDVLTEHKIIDHNSLALYVCDECNCKYTIERHLKIHERLHDTSPLYCIMCGMEIENREKLQDHLKEHLEYSVPCSYCDLVFLDRKACDEHISAKHYHKGKKQRRNHKSKFIMEKVIGRSKAVDSNQTKSACENLEDKNYEAKILILRKSISDVNSDNRNISVISCDNSSNNTGETNGVYKDALNRTVSVVEGVAPSDMRDLADTNIFTESFSEISRSVNISNVQILEVENSNTNDI